ncbi:unnamed protein product [Bursaphelenchus okinawaensis]|uniref:Uncharacterized protein n=1 Tax=Bursaphelenchus okinawaensis TaxID=465554 RepID=A0A811JT60_9BILA|nr:unnamed protein product [Bursaphelenchus okinawaensis]CAG9081874.1 unnamed protein product [Bursaphelenchus okinawaensis]
MSVRRKREETFMTDPEPAFLNRQHMRKFCIYLLSTLWIQYLTNYMLPAQVFTVQVDPEASLKLLPKIQPYIKHIMDLHMYATFFKPMIETYSCIMFLRN